MWSSRQWRLLAAPVRTTVGRCSHSEKKPAEQFQEDSFLRKSVKKPELAPLLVILAGAVCWAFYSMFHASTTKSDVRINPFKKDQAPHMEIGATEKTKLYVVDPKIYKADREMEELRRSLYSSGDK